MEWHIILITTPSLIYPSLLICQLSCSWSLNHPSINDSLLLIISFPKIACMKSQIYLSSEDLFQDCMKSLLICQLSCSWSVNHPSINDSLLLIISFPKIACMKSQIYLSSKDLFQDCMKSLSFSKKEKEKRKKRKKRKEDCMKSWTKVHDVSHLSIYDHMLHYNVFSKDLQLASMKNQIYVDRKSVV